MTVGMSAGVKLAAGQTLTAAVCLLRLFAEQKRCQRACRRLLADAIWAIEYVSMAQPPVLPGALKLRASRRLTDDVVKSHGASLVRGDVVSIIMGFSRVVENIDRRGGVASAGDPGLQNRFADALAWQKQRNAWRIGFDDGRRHVTNGFVQRQAVP